ncbi:hypothetical protein G7K_5805-t1 [Saitoella complicata NRRL Y-17804]|uniref:Uncharacterized protein n=1 Tax=Saitoella complicata (strain BCRC 22490 / CBS 7301 / JCM 7358 / NBRC 10748 / NRRL Y-17804) TaxID=698492 RepID=A0A0E9NPA5_SAICN|nr:hypothetical protein G7K_5805-t1 [Saitoella complicata NRRL Y-17804]
MVQLVGQLGVSRRRTPRRSDPSQGGTSSGNRLRRQITCRFFLSTKPRYRNKTPTIATAITNKSDETKLCHAEKLTSL